MDLYAAAAAPEAALPRPLNGYKVDYYEPTYSLSSSDDEDDNNYVANSTLYDTTEVGSSPQSSSSLDGEESSAYSIYSSEQTKLLADCIHRAIFEAAPSQVDGPPLPSKIIIDELQKEENFQDFIVQHKALVDYLINNISVLNISKPSQLNDLRVTDTYEESLELKPEALTPVKDRSEDEEEVQQEEESESNRRSRVGWLAPILSCLSPRSVSPPPQRHAKTDFHDPVASMNCEIEPSPTRRHPAKPYKVRQEQKKINVKTRLTKSGPSAHRAEPISQAQDEIDIDTRQKKKKLNEKKDEAAAVTPSPHMRPSYVTNCMYPSRDREILVSSADASSPPLRSRDPRAGYAVYNKQQLQLSDEKTTPPPPQPPKSLTVQPQPTQQPQPPRSSPMTPYYEYPSQFAPASSPSPIYQAQPMRSPFSQPQQPQQQPPQSQYPVNTYAWAPPASPYHVYAPQGGPSPYYGTSYADPFGPWPIAPQDSAPPVYKREEVPSAYGSQLESEKREEKSQQQPNEDSSEADTIYAALKNNFYYQTEDNDPKPSLYEEKGKEKQTESENTQRTPRALGLSDEQSKKILEELERERKEADAARKAEMEKYVHALHKFVLYYDNKNFDVVVTGDSGQVWKTKKGDKELLSVLVMDATSPSFSALSAADIVSVFYDKLKTQLAPNASFECKDFSEHEVFSNTKLAASKLDWTVTKGEEKWQGRQYFILDTKKLFVFSVLAGSSNFDRYWEDLAFTMAECSIEKDAEAKPKEQRDWNAEFQAIRKIAQSERAKPLAAFTSEFVQTATRIGKTIILEAHLESRQKSIPPKDVGGVAGGSKFMAEGIFFKFAKDELGLYGGDEFACKACDHELKGLNALLNCWIEDLNFPCICIVDFLGFRLIASTILPVGSDTIVYGSNNGGVTVRDEDPILRKQVEVAAELLNLKGHYVGKAPGHKFLYLAGDVEGHKGHDGKLYLLDTARVFPPDKPKRSIRGGHLYRLLRPELVKSNPVPLSSDAFTRWGNDNKDEHNKEVAEAVKRLNREVVPKFAEKFYAQLDQYDDEGEKDKGAIRPGWEGAKGVTQLIQWLHKDGINVRRLGKVYKHLSALHLRHAQQQRAETEGVGNEKNVASVTVSAGSSFSMRLVLTEMVARVAKVRLRQLLREEMKNYSSNKSGDIRDGSAAYKRVIVNFFNTMFFGAAITEEEHNFFWDMEIGQKIEEKFDIHPLRLVFNNNNNLNNLNNVKLRDVVDLRALFSRLQSTMGIKFESSQVSENFDIMDRKKKMKSFEEEEENSVKILTLRDLKRFEPTVKSMRYVAMYEGFAFLTRADNFFDEAEVDYDETKLRKAGKIYSKAAVKFQECYASMPLEPNGLMNWGYALMKLGQIEFIRLKRGDMDVESTIRKASRLFTESTEKYSDSLKLSTQNTTTYTVGQGKYNMGLSVYHHCKLYWHQQQQPQQQPQQPQHNEKHYKAQFRKLAKQSKAIYKELKEANEKEQEKLMRGNVDYMLACIAAMSGKEEESKKWLYESRKVCLSLTELDAEEFNTIRKTKWFIKLCEEVKRQ